MGDQHSHGEMESQMSSHHGTAGKRLTKLARVHFQWIKGHSGQEGNEEADKLAGRGKQTTTHNGTTATTPIWEDPKIKTKNPDWLIKSRKQQDKLSCKNPPQKESHGEQNTPWNYSPEHATRKRREVQTRNTKRI